MNQNTQAFMAFLFVFFAMLASQSVQAVYVATPVIEGLTNGYYKPLTTPGLAGPNFSASGKVLINGKFVNIPGYIPPASTAVAAARNSLWLNPWLVGLYLLGWADEAGLGSDFVAWTYYEPAPVSVADPNKQYKAPYPWNDVWHGTPSAACAYYVSSANYNWTCGQTVTGEYPGSCDLHTPVPNNCGNEALKSPWLTLTIGTVTVCPFGSTGTPPNCVWVTESRPATEADFQALPAPPAEALAELAPQVGVPVDDPVFEPATVEVGEPYTRPDGVTVQPMAKISPAGGGQVAVDTYDQPISGSDGVPYPAPPPPEDTPETAPSETQCDKYPASLGCANLDIPDGDSLPSEDRSISLISPVSIGGAGSCPAPMTADFLGQTVEMSFDPLCQFADSLRPVVLVLAWLSAGVIFIGGVRNG